MASKFPQFRLPFPPPTKNSDSKILGERFPTFEWGEISEFGESIGRGSFGSVSVAKLRKEQVVVKKLHSDGDDTDKQLFLKEARVLKRIDSQHVVRLKAACVDPCAIALEYVYFDFSPFGSDVRVSGLDEFLKFTDKNDLVNEFPVQVKIATDAAKGVLYLHQKGIVHRDIKTSNILVSNKHYINIADKERVQAIWMTNPIECKLADFGESRSQVIQTASICHTATGRIVRGTPVYRAPELFLSETGNLSIEDLKAVDVWALGMVFFALLNPNLRHPYQIDLLGVCSPLEALKGIILRGQHPKHSEKYAINQATDWITIWRMYERCTRYNPRERESIATVVQALEENGKIACVDLPLSVSQNSALEEASLKSLEAQIKRKRSYSQAVKPVANDATNGCGFLSMHFAHCLLNHEVCTSVPNDQTWKEIAKLSEEVIKNTPLLINDHRDLNMYYDVMEAYQLFRSLNVIETEYELTEEIISADSAFSIKGRSSLQEAIQELSITDSNINVGIYTCGRYIFTIGSLYGQYFIMDTHTIDKELGGNGRSGILKVFTSGKESSRHLTEWIWKRLKHVQVKSNSLQSLTVLKEKRMKPSPYSVPPISPMDVECAPTNSAPLLEGEHEIDGQGQASSINSPVKKKPKKNGTTGVNQTTSFSRLNRPATSCNKAVHDEDFPDKEDAVIVLSDDEMSDLTCISQCHQQNVLSSLCNEEEARDSNCLSCKQAEVLSLSDESAESSSSDDQTSGQNSESILSNTTSEEKSQQKFWKGNLQFPVYKMGQKQRFSPSEAMSILRKESMSEKSQKCERHPLKVRENVSFLVDLSRYKNWEDVKQDMNGVYSVNLRCAVWTIEIDPVTQNCEVISKRSEKLLSENHLHFIQHSKKNKANNALIRSIFLLKNKDGGIVNNVCLLQYHLTTDITEFIVGNHGNARSSKPFYPTQKSTLTALKREVEKKSSTSVIYNNAVDAAGGICGATTPASLPRSREQIRKLKTQHKKVNSPDPVDDLLVYVRDKEENLVLNHTDFPFDTWVLGTDVMCTDLKRFTTSPVYSYPLSVDPTFNMGKFEVTPIVMKNLLLESSRTGEHPIFIGPTMIHHKKDYAQYKILSSSCISKCKELSKVKAFVTDGEKALQQAFKDDLQAAKSLRCFRHFEGNCRDKLNAIGIRDKKEQKYFVEKTFGMKGKSEGILDAEDENDLRSRLDSLKEDIEKAECNLIKNKEHKPQYWLYLDNHFKMMKKSMIGKVRRKAGLTVVDGKPIRCFTNMSESMNNLMKSEKEAFLKDNPDTSTLSKLQFTKHVFEKIHSRQQQEFALALTGTSSEYTLTDNAKYLEVPPETWVDWHEDDRKMYLSEVNKMSMEDIYAGKEVKLPKAKSSETEFKDVSLDIADHLLQHCSYSKENASQIKDEVLALINHPHAIKKQPSLDGDGGRKFHVASKHAKNFMVEVTVYKDHTVCKCGRYRHDKVCKHSLAVAECCNILKEHLRFISKKTKSKNRTALAEINVNAEVAGKKGGRNKFHFKPGKKTSPTTPTHAQCSNKKSYTEIYHNNNKFLVELISKKSTRCSSCGIDFCRLPTALPHDAVVLSHKERWYYPVDGDWSKKKASSKETTKYYHLSKACLMKRFPYFTSSLLQISQHNLQLLSTPQKNFITEEFGLAFP